MTQAILSARLDVIAALVVAAAGASGLRQVELIAALQHHAGMVLRLAALDARENHTVREVADALEIPHSVLIRQLRGGGPVMARAGRSYYTPASRNATSTPVAELPQAS